MRVPGGMKAIDEAIEKLSKTHAEHIAQYGTGNEMRLTGKVIYGKSLLSLEAWMNATERASISC